LKAEDLAHDAKLRAETLGHDVKLKAESLGAKGTLSKKILDETELII